MTCCIQDNFDEEGNPRVQYYIKYSSNLSIKQEDQLYLKILRDIKEFCASSGIVYDEELDVDFILLAERN
ncbi:hypothetical protein [Methanobrevibacter sp.]|uniref:hypothetical protein n=1 Tax=Methanobrevibacter sp. TaxID=66852 RepID=UPI0025DCDDBC|nr:hypothetical protein [Methanobrevibacter sp.]MBQ2666265.1 hypothetical protein [Methanobrevibacter sp.]